MKHVRAFLSIFLLFISVVLLNSCSKKTEDGLSPEIQKIVPEAVLKDARAKGMIIYEGQVPPSIEGIYIAGPFELLSPYGPEDSWEKGKIIADYKYRLYDQSSDKKSLKLDFKNNGSDQATGLGSFISGKDNKFTIFAEVTGTSSGVDYKQLVMLSGEITASGIKDFQHSLYITEKDEDPGTGQLIPLNTGRIWFDNDRFANTVSSYRQGVPSTTSIAAMATAGR